MIDGATRTAATVCHRQRCPAVSQHLHMKSTSRASLVVLLSVAVALSSAASSGAASAHRGDVVFIENAWGGSAVNFRVRSPTGVVRGNLRLSRHGNMFFQRIGMSKDGNLAFLLRFRYNTKGGDKKGEDVWVVAVKGAGAPKVLSKHKVAPFMKSSLAGCRPADTAAVAAGLLVGGQYPVYLGLACNSACNPKYDDVDFALLSATWVLHLSYDVRTRNFAKIGATRTSVEKVCSREPAYQIRALYVPRLPGGQNGEPLMVFSHIDAKSFQLRGVKPASRVVLSWRGDVNGCTLFIAGPSEIVQIKRTAKGQRVVTKVGRIPATLLPGNYACGMATLEGGSQPFYAATFRYDDGPDLFEDKDIYKEYVVKHNKARLGRTGKLAFEMKSGSPVGGDSSLIAVVP